jgi:hypothetical protein
MVRETLANAIVGAVAADEDRVHRRLHVVVDAPGARPAEEGERLVVGVEDHLLRLAGIGSDKQHPAVAKPDMGDLHRGGHAVDQNDLMAPVELVGLARIEAERHVGYCRGFGLRPRPGSRIPAHGIIAAAITQGPELLEDPDVGQALALRPPGVLGQHVVELGSPGPDLRQGLYIALIGELRRAGANNLPHRLPRHPQLTADLLDRFPILKIRPPDLRNRLHHQHPKLGSRFPRKHVGPPVSGGSLLDADHPNTGSFLHAGSQSTGRARR